MNPIERIKGPIFELFDWMTGRGSMEQTVIAFFAVAVVIFLVFPLHECARGYVAKALGDDTGEREGRLSLNPLLHIDPMGAVCMCFCCFGWSRHMPVNINRCNKVKTKTAVVLTSLAGPLGNILMAYICIIVYKILILNAASFSNPIMLYWVLTAIYSIADISVGLAILMLLPVPPFDGCDILCCFLPRNGVLFIERNARTINLVFFFALILGVLDLPLGILSNGVMFLLDSASFFLG